MVTKKRMIAHQLKNRGIRNPKVLRAMEDVDRALFVPREMKSYAYEDSPLPIGGEQTISQPYIVAQMAELLDLNEDDVILEVGAGCGYNAAILSRMVSFVYSIEIIKWLAEQAKKNITKTGIKNINIRYGDGYKGWPEKAPFDKIILTAATPKIPEPLKLQLKVGGKMIAPLGGYDMQKLRLLEKVDEKKFVQNDSIWVRFVPMTGKVQD